MTRLLTRSAHATLSVAYAIALPIGLATLPSPSHPIQDPWFTTMELLILAIAPCMVAFAVGVHERASEDRRPAALLAVMFMSLCVGVTCCVHFSVLVLRRQPEFAGTEWWAQVFAFRWPSVVYALDVLAWDVFFALGAGCMALALPRQSLARTLLFASAALALASLAGVPTGDMRLRNVGILGYALLLPIAAVVLARGQERGST